MSSKRVQPASECQACGGTGYVAGARPIKTGPYVLEPPPCPVCGGTGRAPQPKECAKPTTADSVLTVWHLAGRGVGPAARATHNSLASRSIIILLSGSHVSLASERISSERTRQRGESFRKWWATFTRLPDCPML
jgi:hypothetical protein